MRLTVIMLSGIVTLCTISGCASRNVAVVTDTDKNTSEIDVSLGQLVGQASVNENARLVIFGISYKNPLLFRNKVWIQQYPRAKTGRSYLEIQLHDADSGILVLLKFRGDAGNTAYLQLSPCISARYIRCGFGDSSGNLYIKIDLPPPGKVTYAGYLSYEIVDQFPHRGDQNFPRVINLNMADRYGQDIQAAIKKWSILTNRKIEKGIASVQTGSAMIFVFDKKVYSE